MTRPSVVDPGVAPLPAFALPRVGRIDRVLFEQFWRFSVVGVTCTTVFAVLFLIIQPGLGPQLANFVAMLTAAVLNTAANRAFTFGFHGSRGLAVHHAEGVVVFLLGWALTAGALFLWHRFAAGTSRELELIVLLTANVVGTAFRFMVFRRIFRAETPALSV